MRGVLLLFNIACLFRTKLAGVHLWVLKPPVYMPDLVYLDNNIMITADDLKRLGRYWEGANKYIYIAC